MMCKMHMNGVEGAMIAVTLLLAGCSSTTGLYQCHNNDVVDYVEATNINEASVHFHLAHPNESNYACSYVDHTNIGRERGNY